MVKGDAEGRIIRKTGKAGVALSKRGLGRSASFALVIQSSTAAEASIALETGEPA